MSRRLAMKAIGLIAVSLIALYGAAGCDTKNDGKLAEDSQSKPVSATTSATKADSSTAGSDESPAMVGDEDVASEPTTAAAGETPTDSADADSENSDATGDNPESTEPPAP